MRYNKSEIEQFTHEAITKGQFVLRAHFPAEKLRRWNEEFQPLLLAHVERESGNENRGSHRYYVTLPLELTTLVSLLFSSKVITDLPTAAP